MALTLTRVTCDYAPDTAMSSRAIEDVSLTLQPGGMTVVVGPTGSGKTTLLRAAAGLLTPTSGSVLVDGAPVSDAGSVPGAVGLVFQRPEAQFFALTVEEDCAFGPRNLGRSRDMALADARAALEAVGLDPVVFGPREPWGLSGGEARRAALAGVLAMRPRYLLLDEPTAGLDAAGRRAVRAALAPLRERAGVLVVTHDPDEFLPMADAVLVLSAGRSVYGGDIAGLLDALPGLSERGAIEPPEVARALMLASAAGATLAGGLTFDPALAAGLLARAAGGGRA
jgi:energy-coupling factor transport system ATP-binding protein